MTVSRSAKLLESNFSVYCPKIFHCILKYIYLTCSISGMHLAFRSSCGTFWRLVDDMQLSSDHMRQSFLALVP